MKKESQNKKKAVVTSLKVKSGVKAGPVVVGVIGPDSGVVNPGADLLVVGPIAG